MNRLRTRTVLRQLNCPAFIILLLQLYTNTDTIGLWDKNIEERQQPYRSSTIILCFAHDTEEKYWQGTRFIGNGSQNKYIRRKYQTRRRKMGKLKKLSAIRKQADKEHRYMKDQNHKISRKIVNMAIEEQVSVIKIEKLTSIRQTTRTSRKNAKNLHNWSFHQLQMFIAYKAALAGIRVEEVNPAYTSQSCPNCGKRNKAIDRMYQCSCRFHAHRDRVGAINIMRQPVADSNSLPA